MSAKIKTITLAPVIGSADYKVLRTINSIDYAPGSIVKRKDVESLCASRDWKVIISER